MLLSWKEDLETGYTEIDQNHKEIFSRLNEFHEACRSGKGKAVLEELMAFLVKYIHAHFALEEMHMKRANYPSFLEHRDSHDQFRTACLALSEELKTAGAGFSIVVATNFFLGGWWREHICTMDKAMAAHLRDFDITSTTRDARPHDLSA